jgi:NAD(P)H-dependent FMN reductase
MSNLLIISGSPRPDSQSQKVAHYIGNLKVTGQWAKVTQFSLADTKLALVCDDATPEQQANSKALQQMATDADAVVIIAPEYGGMVPSQLKNLLLTLSNGELHHKPAMIVGVSSGMGGSYPIAELRSAGYKNAQVIYIPHHFILRNAGEFFNTPEAQSPLETELRDRLIASVQSLALYSDGLKSVREALNKISKSYPYGM